MNREEARCPATWNRQHRPRVVWSIPLHTYITECESCGLFW